MAVREITHEGKIFSISYEVLNPSSENCIVFLHGWGSNKEIMKQAFGDHLKEYRHIYIDLPGFGKSPNVNILNTNDYADIVKEFLTTLNLNATGLMVAGHSFGGKIATLLKPKKLILLSSAGILEEKPFSVKMKIKAAKVLNALGLSGFAKIFRSKDAHKMSREMYETFKNVVDEDFSGIFAAYGKEAKIFWGDDDKATSLDSGKKIASLIKNSSFKSYDGDHYFFLKYAKDISREMGSENLELRIKN